MNSDDAKKLKPGDVVFNIFQEELIVSSIHTDQNNTQNIICVNTGLFLESYPSSSLYKDLNDLTLPEYSFLLWARKNKNTLLSSNNEDIDIIRQSYIDGYNTGFSDKPRCSGSKCKGKDNVVD